MKKTIFIAMLTIFILLIWRLRETAAPDNANSSLQVKKDKSETTHLTVPPAPKSINSKNNDEFSRPSKDDLPPQEKNDLKRIKSTPMNQLDPGERQTAFLQYEKDFPREFNPFNRSLGRVLGVVHFSYAGYEVSSLCFNKKMHHNALNLEQNEMTG